MPATAKAREVLDIFDRIAAVFEEDREPDPEEETRDDVLADVLDMSEESQAVLAAALCTRAPKLAKKTQDGDEEAAALSAVILRALAAHTQAEAVRGLMDSPDLSQFVNVEEDETMPPEWDDQDEGGA